MTSVTFDLHSPEHYQAYEMAISQPGKGTISGVSNQEILLLFIQMKYIKTRTDPQVYTGRSLHQIPPLFP